jgi:hypothetical protein
MFRRRTRDRARARASGQSAWTPAQLGASLALWLDAEDATTITLNGSNVAQWDDKSENNNNAVQATAASQPAYNATVLDGKAALVWPNAINSLSIKTQNTFTVYQTFFVMRFADGIQATAYATVQGLFRVDLESGLNLGNGTAWYVNNYNNARINGGPLGQINLLGPALPRPKTILNSIRSLLPAPSSALTIGFNAAGRAWSGPIGEVLSLTEEISEADRQKLEGYLAWKWGGI